MIQKYDIYIYVIVYLRYVIYFTVCNKSGVGILLDMFFFIYTFMVD